MKQTISLLFFSLSLSAQPSFQILQFDTQEPLQGATISKLGLLNTIISDFEGKFSWPYGQDSVIIRYVGFQPLITKIEHDNTIFYLKPNIILEELIVKGVKTQSYSSVSFKNITLQEIKNRNTGEHLIYTLEKISPSVISYSESGQKSDNYGFMRLRGMNQERINMTLNGIPLNDMVDFGVYFSNMPGLSSIIHKAQIQRGTGTLANGASSFAGAIHFETLPHDTCGHKVEFQSTYGSFHTFRNHLKISTSITKYWSAIVSIHQSESEGFRNHTASKGQSIFLSLARQKNNSIVKFLYFSGENKNGLSYVPITYNEFENNPKANALNENDTDQFKQNLYQLQYINNVNDQFQWQASVYYNHALGDYFYSYILEESLYQINYPLINQHLGANTWMSKEWDSRFNSQFGIHVYHFQRENREHFMPDQTNPYYKDKTLKNELTPYFKTEWSNKKWNLEADLQWRLLKQTYDPDTMFVTSANWSGNDFDLNYSFLNTHFGLSYKLKPTQVLYFSLGNNFREPTRIDQLNGFSFNTSTLDLFISKQVLQPEMVKNLEIGHRYSTKKWNGSINGFLMKFNNELSQTGEILNFGIIKRQNIEHSKRYGLEWSNKINLFPSFSLQHDITWMQSKLNQITVNGEKFIDKEGILTPEWNINFSAQFSRNGFLITPSYRWVSNAFTEITNQPIHLIPEYHLFDILMIYSFRNHSFKLDLVNLTNKIYASSGAPINSYTPGYYSQAGFQFYATYSVKLSNKKAG